MTAKEKQEYELALRVGKQRYGSPCKHKKVKGNTCVNCLRKVIRR